MKIFPAIDIKNGKCVRLLKGDFNQSTEYEKSPIDQAKEFSNLGYKDIHIIDLDGALNEKPVNCKVIEEICKIKKLRIQIGGGIRNLDDAEILFNSGADKIALNTAVFDSPNLIKKLSKKYGSQSIVLSIEAKKNYNKNYWEALTNNGRDHSGYEIIKWAKKEKIPPIITIHKYII